MGLRETVQKAALAGFNAIGNIAIETRYNSYVTAAYNVSAGSNTRSVKQFSVFMIMTEYTSKEVDGVRIVEGDRKALFVQSKLPVKPSTKDQIQVRDNGQWTKYDVVHFSADPVDAIWELQVRQIA